MPRRAAWAPAGGVTWRGRRLMLNPHNRLIRIGEPPPWPLPLPPAGTVRWRCAYCGLEGTWEELHTVACSYVYPPCPSCGQTPECAPDCRGIAEALSDSRVHIIGSLDPDLRKAWRQ